jgi:GNAT superfamily N-acetyltransferase
MTPDFLAATEATWPPAATRRVGPFLLRDGAGGGQRVSAATVVDSWGPDDLDAVIAAHDVRLFRVLDGQGDLAAALERRGFPAHDETVGYICAADPDNAGPGAAEWPPAPDTRALWQQDGVGPDRVAVMDRVAGPKTALVIRDDNGAVAAGFAGVDGRWVILHALFVAPVARRRGFGAAILDAVGHFGAAHRADMTGLLVTAANAGARSLYRAYGMHDAGGYHYRRRAGGA